VSGEVLCSSEDVLSEEPTEVVGLGGIADMEKKKHRNQPNEKLMNSIAPIIVH